MAGEAQTTTQQESSLVGQAQGDTTTQTTPPAETKTTETTGDQSQSKTEGEDPKKEGEASGEASGEKKDGEGEEKKEGDEVVPLTTESIKLPEGIEVSDTHVASFLEVMNDATLDPAGRAQRLIDLQAELMNEVSERGNQAFKTMQEDWQRQVREDPAIGGDKLDANLGKVSKILDKYGTPELREAFDMTGAGNHPEVVRFMVKLAEEFSEGNLHRGNPADHEAGSAASRMYPSMKK